MARRGKVHASGRKVLVIDDNHEVLEATARLLSKDGHEVHTADNGPAGVELARSIAGLDLILVDYFMPGMTGEQVIQAIRTFEPLVQVVLQTGYASERPPREMLNRLDIQGYHDKSEGPEKMCLWVDVGLKAASRVKALQQSRLGLRYILDATPELHKIQPLEELLQGVLTQTAGLLGAVDSFLAIGGGARDGFVALDDEGDLRICAGTGRFAPGVALSTSLDEHQREAVAEALQIGEIPAADGMTIVPLCVGEARVGLIYLDRPIALAGDSELLAVFANQAAVAIHNTTLYELAAIDTLTRTFTRRFFDQALNRELRAAARWGQDTALLLVDVDDLKVINDRGGHLAGDEALRLVGQMLREATRATDIVGRWGGDEFAVILPRSGAAEARVVAERVLAMARGLEMTVGGAPHAVGVSLGVGVLPSHPAAARLRASEAFERAVASLIAAADEVLYTAKRTTKGTLGGIHATEWPSDASPRAASPAETAPPNS